MKKIHLGLIPGGLALTEPKAGHPLTATPGPNVAVWLHLDFQKLLRNGSSWVVKCHA